VSATSSMWAKACSKLNVKPRQFATLLVITFTALGVLGYKFFVHSPRKAGAQGTSETSKSAKKQAATGAGAGSGATASAAVTPSAEVAAEQLHSLGLPVEVVEFRSRPLRDPFLPFFVYTPSNNEEGLITDAGSSDGSSHGAATAKGGKGAPSAKKTGTGGAAAAAPPPEGPQGLVLKAIIAGKVAVLNSMSVEQGDVIRDETAQAYTVSEIRERSIVLTDGQRRFTLGYSPASSKPASQKSAPRR